MYSKGGLFFLRGMLKFHSDPKRQYINFYIQILIDKVIGGLYKVTKKLPIINRYVTKEFLKYFFVGITAFGITYSVNSSLILIIDSKTEHSDENRGIYISTAFVVAYIASFVYNFSMSRSWTFKYKGDGNYKQLLKFFIVHIVTLIVASIAISTLDKNGITPLISLPFIAFIQMCTGYLLYKFWVFKLKN